MVEIVVKCKICFFSWGMAECKVLGRRQESDLLEMNGSQITKCFENERDIAVWTFFRTLEEF